MNTKAAIRANMDLGLMVLNTYISDLSDADLLRRPGPGCNHLAWQLGHLINSEAFLLNMVCPGQAATLPEGFAAQHAKEASASDDPAKFRTKQEYVDLFQRVRASTLAALEKLSDADLDRPSPESFRERFPTVGHMLTLIASHPTMHAGQFVVVRRLLGKPVLI
jgi:uncharacterized damage-inducible protein DinB